MALAAIGLFLILLGFSFLFDGLPHVLLAIAAIVAGILAVISSRMRIEP